MKPVRYYEIILLSLFLFLFRNNDGKGGVSHIRLRKLFQIRSDHINAPASIVCVCVDFYKK